MSAIMQKTRTQTLSSTERALMAYLDDMLRESTTVVVEEKAPSAPPAKKIVSTPEHSVRVAAPLPEISLPRIEVPAPVVEPVLPREPSIRVEPVPPREPSLRVEPVTPREPSIRVEPPATKRSAPDVSTDPIPTMPALPDWLDGGRPQWAEAPFEALIFRVGGLKMAVPLFSLGLIHPIQKRFNELPGQNPWFLGMLRTPQATIRVIDTALCVMPERHDPGMRDSLKYVITLHGYEWGLAAHDVEKAIQLDPSKIQWRTRRGKRPWLAGTVVDHMCALIDSEGFHQVIAAAESSS